MKNLLDKTMTVVMALLPFLRRSRPDELKTFTNLITGQFAFLIDQLEKALQDYCQLSAKIREMHNEIQQLHRKLNDALQLQCLTKDCNARQ